MRRLVVCTLLLLLAACSVEQPALTASDVQMPPPLPGVSMGAAYLELSNNSRQTIRINRVSSPELVSVDMHETVVDDGVSRMKKLPEIEIAPQQSVIFERGGKHLMLRYPDQPLTQVTLQFYADDELFLSVAVSLED